MKDWELGLNAFREGRLREAVDRLRSAAAEHESKVSLAVRFQTLSYLGAALYALGYTAEAIIAFQQAIQVAPPPNPPPDLTVNLASALLACGRRDEAQQALRTTLRNAPGHLEAQMLLERLDQQPAGSVMTGATLGVSPEGVRKYLRTLSIKPVGSDGLDAGQVQLALTQIERYLDQLIVQLAARDKTIAQLNAEMVRFHEMEDQLVENLIKAQQAADQQKREAAGASPQDETGPALTPLETLFQQQP